MKLKILIIYFLLNLSLNLYSEKAKSLLILGDSISAGYGMSKEKQWSEVLKEKLNQEKISLKIINASVSGETTGGGLVRSDKLLQNNMPSYLLIELGGNDALRGYPPQTVKSNLLEIINLGKTYGSKSIIMQIRIPPNYGNRYRNEFESIYTEIAEETGSLYMPFMLNNIALEKNLMMADGIHPTEEAQPLIAEEIFNFLKDLGIY
ncbi:MAG: arylesterase [Pseudomonadota bacterium]|nr:arylesterase [Gammaproteobacteria bacterium]MEC7917159.1 arylesterase [Pseudomonadota bacterium]|tara:strand:- start:1687 stop:2304 length:618 start_codon:yes stop_codon:yes gene_type:complete